MGEATVEMQRMYAALTRTQPTQRSCEVRLALAEWLHRRLRRAKLHTEQLRFCLITPESGCTSIGCK